MTTLLAFSPDIAPLTLSGPREARLRAFAARNGFVYDRGAPGPPAAAGLFGVGHRGRTLRRFRGGHDGRRLEIGNFACRTRYSCPWSRVLTGYLILGPVPDAASAPPGWARRPAPAAEPTAHVEAGGGSVLVHTLEPFAFDHAATWDRIALLVGHASRL
ncbi:hypothetical protein [Herbiconiux sp.]|uniref:hypothetical protein n=1 Tax=Herbiconiux sp. TaxID=1871186 RepID=UPI0025C1F82C|nr:hypothetical protein [Herbiconiux sp.]